MCKSVEALASGGSWSLGHHKDTLHVQPTLTKKVKKKCSSQEFGAILDDLCCWRHKPAESCATHIISSAHQSPRPPHLKLLRSCPHEGSRICSHATLTSAYELGKANVSDMSTEVVIQQHVGRLEVQVYQRLRVQVHDACGNVHSHLVTPASWLQTSPAGSALKCCRTMQGHATLSETGVGVAPSVNAQLKAGLVLQACITAQMRYSSNDLLTALPGSVCCLI